MLAVAPGWFLFLHKRRTFRSLEQQLKDAQQQLKDAQQRPHRFQDDCMLDEKTGMYRHKTKPGFFCVACAAESGGESPMREEKDGWGWSCPVKSAHFVRGPNWSLPQSVVRRSNWSLGF
jgi:hypothetical protein